MPEEQEACQEDWKRRFQAVGRAQARYLYLLLVASVFFWALHVQVMVSAPMEVADQQLPLVGVTVNRVVVWATAPIVLGFTLLAAFGTFHAIKLASDKLGTLVEGDQGFERLDVSPTAIDFIVYTKSPSLRRLGLLSYPGFLSVVYVEAWWIWFCLLRSDRALPGWKVLVIIGAVVLLWCTYRLVELWLSKGKSALHRASRC